MFLLLFLGAFAELRKATIGFALSVLLGQLGSHWTEFHEIWYLSIFRKFVGKFSSAMAAYAAIALATKHIDKYAGTTPVILARH